MLLGTGTFYEVIMGVIITHNVSKWSVVKTLLADQANPPHGCFGPIDFCPIYLPTRNYKKIYYFSTIRNVNDSKEFIIVFINVIGCFNYYQAFFEEKKLN